MAEQMAKKRKSAAPRELVLRNVTEVAAVEQYWQTGEFSNLGKPPKNYNYIDELARLQFELIKLQEWVRLYGLKVVVIFEGRDAAGKGGVIKRIAESLNPRICRVVALGTPTERQRSQWYFQRYVAELPAKGEIVLFDRSWYNRAGVEHVLGYCSDDEYKEFLRSCPQFEAMLVRSGIYLIKYWFSVSDEEQERRFQERIRNPIKRWKLSPMDVESRNKWVEYSRAKDQMLVHTDIPEARWNIVESDDKRAARINMISHLLSAVPWQPVQPPELELPERPPSSGYQRPPRDESAYVPDRAAELTAAAKD